MDEEAQDSIPEEFNPPKLLGAVSAIISTGLVGLCGSAIFSVPGLLKVVLGLVFVMLLAWSAVCHWADKKADNLKNTEIRRLRVENAGLATQLSSQAETNSQTLAELKADHAEEIAAVKKDTESRHRDKVSDSVGRVFKHLQEESHDAVKDPTGKQLIIHVLDSLADLMGGERPRACLYEPIFIEDDGDPDRPTPAAHQHQDGILPERLELMELGGRRGGEPPRSEFLRSEDSIHGVISVYDSGDPQVVHDTASEAYRRGIVGKEYKTFANVRTGIGSYPNGVLSVDSCTPNSLESSHIGLMHVFAKLLAVGIKRHRDTVDHQRAQDFRATRDELR